MNWFNIIKVNTPVLIELGTAFGELEERQCCDDAKEFYNQINREANLDVLEEIDSELMDCPVFESELKHYAKSEGDIGRAGQTLDRWNECRKKGKGTQHLGDLQPEYRA